MKMFAGLAAGLTVAVFASFVKGGIDAADAMDELREKTGLLMKDVAGVRLIFQREGFGDQELVTSMSKLSKAITTGGGGLAALKVATKEASGEFRSTQAVLYDVADRFAEMENGAQKSALAMDIFGKSGVSLIPMLNGGSEGMRDMAEMAQKLGLVISQETATAAGDFNDTLSLIGQGSQGVAQGIAAELLPTLNSLAGSFLTSMTSGDKLASTANVLGGALKILYTVGVGIVEVFSTVGKAVGAAAAMTVAVLSGNFKEAATIHKSLAADIGAGWANSATAISDAWTGAGADTVAAMAKAGKAQKDLLATQEARDAAAKKAAADYAASIKAAQDFAGALEIETAQVGLSADQIKMMAAARAAAKAPTAELRMEIMKAALALDIATKAEAEKVAADKAVVESNKRAADGLADFTKLQQAYGDQVVKSIQAASDEAAKNEELVATFGKTKNAIEQLELARLQDQLAQRSSTGLTLDEITALEALIEAKKRSAAATGSLEVLEKQKKASDDAAAAQVSFWKSIDQTAHDTFISIANGSKDAATRLKETFKNVFFDWLYQMTIKKWIVNIGTSTDKGSTVSSIASLFGDGGSSGGGAGGVLGTASNWLSIGKTIYSGFTGGLASTLGSSISSLGSMLGAEAVSAFGAGMSGGALGASTASAASGYAGTTAAGMGAGAAGAIPVIGWIITAMMTANGLYKQGWDATNGTLSETGKVLGSGIMALNSVLGKIGLSDSAANIFSGQATISKLFGRKNPEIESQGLRGTLTATGTTDAQNYINILQKGGWFRSDKRTSQTAAASAETDKLFDTTMTAMSTAVKAFGKSMGIETATIDSYTKTFDLKLTGKAEQDNAAVAKLFGDVGDELSLRLVPGLAAFAKEGETMSATLQRLAVNYQTVDAVLTATGQSIKLFGVAGIEARENLIAAAGGLDALSSGVSYFQQNWLSEAEQLAPVQKQVTDSLASMGMSAIKTNDQFKAAVLGIDLNTKAGAELYVKMLALAPAFKVVADAADATSKATVEAAKLAAEAAAEATAQAAAIAAQAATKASQDLLTAVSTAFDGVAASVNAQKKLLELAHKASMEAMQAQIDKTGASVTKLKSLSDALGGALSSIRGQSVSELDDRQSGQAQIAAALAIARASGVLPDADSLKGALAAVSKDVSDQFASYEDYQRSNYQTAMLVSDLADLTDSQLSVEQRMLDSLNSQKDLAALAYQDEVARLDGILETAKLQIDLLNGINVGIASIPAALVALAAALGKAQANPTNGNSAVTAMFQNLLGRAPEASGLQFWTGALGAGTSTLSDIQKQILASEEYKKLHPFAVGTNYVPGDMPALIHEGERIIPAADNRELMARLSSGGDNRELLVEILAELRSARAMEESHLYAIAKNTLNAADHLDGAINGETPFAIKEVATEETA